MLRRITRVGDADDTLGAVRVVMPMMCVAAFTLAALSNAAAQPALRHAAATSRHSTPTLVLVSATRDSDRRAIEHLFADELRLALDGINVTKSEFSDGTFGQRPLDQQLARVQTLLGESKGFAAVWLSHGSATSLLLHVAVLTAGRVMVRVFAGNPKRPGYATDLAMATRELLGTAYLFEPRPPSRPVARLVNDVQRRVVATQRSVAWALSTTATAGAGIGWSRGPSSTAGMTVGVERGGRSGWVPHLSLLGERGFLDGSLSRELRATTLGAGIGAAYYWDRAPARFGVVADLYAAWSSLSFIDGAAAEPNLSLWSARIAVGPEIRLQASAKVELLLRISAAWHSQRGRLTLESTGERLFDGAFVTGAATLGIAVSL